MGRMRQGKPKPAHPHKEKQFNFILEDGTTLICGGMETNVRAGELVVFDDR